MGKQKLSSNILTTRIRSLAKDLNSLIKLLAKFVLILVIEFSNSINIKLEIGLSESHLYFSRLIIFSLRLEYLGIFIADIFEKIFSKCKYLARIVIFLISNKAI